LSSGARGILADSKLGELKSFANKIFWETIWYKLMKVGQNEKNSN
jgi:hypothetical protein